MWEHIYFDSTHIALGVGYLIFFLGIVGLLVIRNAKSRLQQRGIFILLLLIGIAVRCVWFFLQPFIMDGLIQMPNLWNVVLNVVPTLFFFQDYLIILLLWAVAHHNLSRIRTMGVGSGGSSTANRHGAFLYLCFRMLMALVWCVPITLFIVDFFVDGPDDISTSGSQPQSIYTTVVLAFVGVFYLFLALGFLCFGFLFVQRLRTQEGGAPSNSSSAAFARLRQRILQKIISTTALCFTVFLCRGSLTLVAVFDSSFGHWWWFDPVYYLITEVVPLCLMLGILYGPVVEREGPADVTAPHSSASPSPPLIESSRGGSPSFSTRIQ